MLQRCVSPRRCSPARPVKRLPLTLHRTGGWYFFYIRKISAWSRLMGRPRKPTHLHLISGSAAKDPQRMRARGNEPEIEGADLREYAAPDHLDKMHRELWNEVRGYLHARVSSEPDLIAFEALVRLVMVMRSGKAVAADYARLQAYLGEFGMTPGSRSKISQTKKPQPNRGFAALKTQ